MHGVDPENTSPDHDDGLLHWTATRDTLTRRPLRIHHEVSGPTWSIPRPLAAVVTAFRHRSIGSTPRLDRSRQPAR
jgi:hypothetical protein